MTKWSKYALLVLTALLSACATLFNTKKTTFTVYTSEPSGLIVAGDTMWAKATIRNVTVNREKTPLPLTVFTDSLRKSVDIKPNLSPTILLNLYFTWISWPGILLDMKTKKGHSYPSRVYIDLRDSNSTYYRHMPLPPAYRKFHSSFKFTPLKLIGLVNPALELCYERGTGKHLSTQLMGAYLLPKSVWGVGSNFNPNIQGFRLALEERFFFKASAIKGPYLGLELDYFRNQYKDIGSFRPASAEPSYGHFYEAYVDSIRIKKQATSFNLKFGWQVVEKRLAIDMYLGLGCRYRDARHYNKLDPGSVMVSPRHPNIDYATNSEGKYWTGNLVLNWRVGWTF